MHSESSDLILWAKEHNSDDDALAVARFASEPEARAMRALHAASTPGWSFFLTWVAPAAQ